jgi:hypothetical protein
MKSTLKFIVFIFLFVGIGCEKNSSSETLFDSKFISKNIVDGTWTITKMMDSGKNETYHFLGFVFDFKSDGSVTARKRSIIETGVWHISENSRYDTTSPELEFYLSFHSSGEFEELNDDWDILELNNSVIKLIDISGGNGGTDYLTFERK